MYHIHGILWEILPLFDWLKMHYDTVHISFIVYHYDSSFLNNPRKVKCRVNTFVQFLYSYCNIAVDFGPLFDWLKMHYDTVHISFIVYHYDSSFLNNPRKVKCRVNTFVQFLYSYCNIAVDFGQPFSCPTQGLN